MNEISTSLQKIARILIQKNWTITTAESCTGGGISAAITSLAGSSQYFERAFVTYSNAAKADLVGVDPALISNHGAVSQQVVEQMAIGALRRANANVAIAVSGIAGPDGGTADKPVGTVWIAIALQSSFNDTDDISACSEQFLFSGDRENIRHQTIKSSFIKLLQLIS